MKKLAFLIFSILIGIGFSACKSESDKKNEAVNKNLDEKSTENLDYLFQLFVGKSRTEIESLMSENAILFTDSEDYLAYKITSKASTQLINFGFYGESKNQDFTVEIEGSEIGVTIEDLYYELRQHNITQFGEPKESIETEEPLLSDEWNIEISGKTGVLKQHLTKTTFTYSFLTQSTETDSDGEWVQAGEDGRLIFVPNK